MATVWIVLRQTLLMFVYMGAGVVLFKKGLITREGSRSLAHLLLYLVLPCVVIKSFCVERTAENTTGLLVSLGAAAVILLLAIVVSRLLFRTAPIDNFSASFSNAGFMGFPLVTAVLGSEAVFYAAGFVALLNALQWTYGQTLLSGDRRHISPANVIKNPLVVSLVVGLAIFFTGLPLPSLALSALQGVAGLNAPLAMIILGVYLAQTKFSELFTQPRLYGVSAVRLVLIPMLTALLLSLLPGGHDTLRTTLLIVASAPVGSNVAVYAQKLGKDYAYAVRLVCLSTILSIITMPVLVAVFCGV